MQLLLPTELDARLVAALKRAKFSEIGGIVMGQHVDVDLFRIDDVTIQDRGGSFASFVRNVGFAIQSLNRYFTRTNRDYRRFNYLGEWHSHPSFKAEPSPRDEQTMRDILDDPKVGANFVVLIVVKLDTSSELEATATVFVPGQRPYRANLIMEVSNGGV
jgi:proteasome lid subunit RPN8/RPN11